MIDYSTLKEKWNRGGVAYAKAINDMVAFGEKYGWDKWKGEEPTDQRGELANEVFKHLKEANQNGKVDAFRAEFPPSHSALIDIISEKGQSSRTLIFLEDQKILFFLRPHYQKSQAYLLDKDQLTKLSPSINAIGKSKQNEVFAVAANNIITTTKGWEGDVISIFQLNHCKDLAITSLIPFNDGKRVLLVSSGGIYLISNESETKIHPELEPGEEEYSIDMENADLSTDNQYIVVGDQCSAHRVLDSSGKEIGSIGQQSEYPHFCLFSKDNKQVITNSCHFYNGCTIAVSTQELNGVDLPEYSDDDSLLYIDQGMRVYAGVSTSSCYILGDAYGYIRAFDFKGTMLWKHFVGSTISGMAISDDEQSLWVASYSGYLHKFQIGKPYRDKHSIGDAKLYEDFRLIFWKEEPFMKW